LMNVSVNRSRVTGSAIKRRLSGTS
jgi:hypothetical protein